MTLDPEGGGTRLACRVEAHVGGKLAQPGSRIEGGFARRMADEFFARFQTALEADPAPDVPRGAPTGAPKKGWFRRLVARG